MSVPGCNSTYRLRYWNRFFWGLYFGYFVLLQQHLPLAVLKHVVIVAKAVFLDSCNSTYRLRYWNFSSNSLHSSTTTFSCNSTYRLRYWNPGVPATTADFMLVATALTACGIETKPPSISSTEPLVATALTACGIETYNNPHKWFRYGDVATALTACGIETTLMPPSIFSTEPLVATALTACGIETWRLTIRKNREYTLQQHLPLAVLKPVLNDYFKN